MRFLTPLYLHNVDEGGRICQDILKPVPHGSWKPSINISSILTSLQVLLSEPNADDPLVTEMATQFQYQRNQFKQELKRKRKVCKSEGRGGEAGGEGLCS